MLLIQPSTHGIGSIPWGVVLNLATIIVGLLYAGLLERLRRNFPSKEDVALAEKRRDEELKDIEEDFRNSLNRIEKDFKDHLAGLRQALVGMIDGQGGKVGNLEHMFTAVRKDAEESKSAVALMQQEMKYLRDTVTRATQVSETNGQQMQALGRELSALATEIRLLTGQRLRDKP